MDTDDAGRRAAERAASAGRRTRELSDRLARLVAGQQPDTASVREAQEQATVAAMRARESAERARLGLERAARAHERTAQVHETAARAGVGDVRHHAELAAAHWDAAAADLHSAEVVSAAAPEPEVTDDAC